MKSFQTGPRTNIHMKVRDLQKSRDFYQSVLEVLGIPVLPQDEKSFAVPGLEISESPTPTQAAHLAFHTNNPLTVALFYETALLHGGVSFKDPRVKNFQTGQYGAIVLDPDGNQVEAIFSGQKSM